MDEGMMKKYLNQIHSYEAEITLNYGLASDA
jgi:hypothetical protein